MKLLIVESPNKIQKIKAILGPGWDVAASVGHIRDLPEMSAGLGIDKANKYKLLYEVSPDKKSVVANLKKKVAECGKENVYLATDPDREGEAISFHLCQALGLDYRSTHRVTFQEITAPAIQAALQNPRTLDIKLVSAQEARRAIDRLVGYEISPVLWKKVESGLSAGRVQSVAVRLVVNREQEIMRFADRYSFGIYGLFQTAGGEQLKARRSSSFPDAAMTEAYLRSTQGQAYTVQDVQKKPVERHPGPAYSTSTLQQDGVKKLKWKVSQVSELAQKLFEQGHITYIRTDSVNLSETAINEAQGQITAQYGASYFQRRTFQNKDGAQEAHEAIRPTHWENRSAGNTDEEKALYALIWNKAVASQMAPARFDETTVTLSSSLPEDLFTTTARVQTFDGYLAVYQEAEEETDDEDDASTLTQPVRAGDVLSVLRMEGRQSYAKPPKRFDEATLVAELEKRQIGRPSTYASILGVIQAKQYVATGSVEGKKLAAVVYTFEAGQLTTKAKTETLGADKNKLLPTEKGTKLSTFLETNFTKIVDYTFTAKCEGVFDKIAAGSYSYGEFLPQFDTNLTGWIQEVEANYKDVLPAEQRVLGEHEGLTVSVGSGKFGPFVQHGDKKYSIKDVAEAAITLPVALAALANATHDVGEYQGKPFGVGKGKFGTFVVWEKQYFNAPAGIEPAQLTAEAAQQLIIEGLAKKAAAVPPVATVGKYKVYQGEKSLYVTDGQNKANLFPSVTVEQAAAMSEEDFKKTIKKFLAWKKSKQ